MAAELVRRMRAGDIGALARALTELERLSRAAPALLAELRPHLGHALIVGFTGAPGAGKSSLVSAYVRSLRERGRTVGVLAVDPSSPISGGAILGDRIRMGEHTGDDGVFIRSLASRGALGGLSPAALRMIDAMDAAGKDVVILETVGAGQSEVDIAAIADVRVVITAPGLGDDIQAMKAGILEIADILVVNKADLPGAREAARVLEAALTLRLGGGRDVPVLTTSATEGEGIAELADAIEAVGRSKARLPLEARRRKRAERLLAAAATRLIEKRILNEEDPAVAPLCDAILDGALAPEEAAARLLAPSRAKEREER